MRTFQQGMLEPEDDLEFNLSDIQTHCYGCGLEPAIGDTAIEKIKQAFLNAGWQPPKYTTESEPRIPGDDVYEEKGVIPMAITPIDGMKIPPMQNPVFDQYKCQSYYNGNNELQDCSCGRCV